MSWLLLITQPLNVLSFCLQYSVPTWAAWADDAAVWDVWGCPWQPALHALRGRVWSAVCSLQGPVWPTPRTAGVWLQKQRERPLVATKPPASPDMTCFHAGRENLAAFAIGLKTDIILTKSSHTYVCKYYKMSILLLVVSQI